MTKYRITVNAINEVYEANSKEEALELYAKDAGYSSYQDIVDLFGEEDLKITEEEDNANKSQ